METIVLFSRSELVHLYGKIGHLLSTKYNIIHLAYSFHEESILREKYLVSQIINFDHEVREIHRIEKLDSELCITIDQLLIEQSDNRFNLNSTIQNDRTFQYITYTESLILAQTYYKFWKNLIISNRVDYILHEPTSLFFNHIASILCKKVGARYITQILVYGEDRYNFMVVSGDNGVADEMNINYLERPLHDDESLRVKSFLSDFRASLNTFYSQYSKSKKYFFKTLTRSFRVSITALKYQLLLKTASYSPVDHVNLFFYKNLSLKDELNKLWGSYFCLKYDPFITEEKYFYYPIHLEPEAVVLYWGDGIYKNQVKLIENIAAQLPPEYYLFVKDHPHAGSYRELIDYRRIKAIPNVKLISPEIPGKIIIKNSIGVITINGTSGFEALLLNKQVYMFGNCFYDKSHRVHKIKNIRDLRQILYDNYQTIYEDDEDLYRFVLSYLNSTHKGFTDYFMNYVNLIGINEIENADLVSQGLRNYFMKFSNIQ